MRNKILLLTSFFSNLYSKYPNKTTNTGKIANYLKQCGYEVEIKKFEEVDTSLDYKGVYVVYHSSEEVGLNYKSYLEDIILCLRENGAILLPNFVYMRAHHNKVMMELIRKNLDKNKFKTINSKIYSLKESVDLDKVKFPVIVKGASGAGSKGVFKVNDKIKLAKVVNRISKNPLAETSLSHYINIFKCFIKFNVLKGKPQSVLENYYINRNMNKFTIQNFIPNLNGDYKVLVYWDKYYVLKRHNRENDFRASGSGIFEYPDNEDLNNILDFAMELKNELNVPWISLDVADNGEGLHLIEFQCLAFGTYTFVNSEYYYTRVDSEWIKKEETPDLEDTFAYAIDKAVRGMSTIN